MKPANLPLNRDQKSDRSIFKRIKEFDKKLRSKEKNTKRFKIGQSVTAGHVRGGHSFH